MRGFPRKHIHERPFEREWGVVTQLDSELEGPMPPSKAFVEPTRESESDTESVRVVPRRRLVLQFARDEDSNGSGDEHQRSEPTRIRCSRHRRERCRTVSKDWTK